LKPEEALRSVLHNCLGMPNEVIPRKLDERAAVYRSLLAGTRTLILLDNAASSAQVRPLLPGDPGCAVIVTSRQNLRGLDDAEPLGLGILPDDEAVALFRTTAGPERFPADDPDLVRIAGLCGGLPLAVRIIAAWMRYRPLLTASDARELLSDERERLAHLRSEDLSVRAAFELSYRRLPDAEQRMFRRLGLIPGLDFDARAAASLAGGDAWPLLESLVDHNLLTQHARGRYRLHDLVRAYARSLAAQEGTAVSGRLLDFYLHAAQAADVHFERRSPGPGQVRPVSAPASAPPLGTAGQARAWVSTELANLNAAAGHAASSGRADFTISLSMALAQYLRVHGPWPQGILLHRLAGAMARETGDSEGQAAALAGSIARAKLDGSDVNQALITGPSGPHGVAIYGNHIYWCNWGKPGRYRYHHWPSRPRRRFGRRAVHYRSECAGLTGQIAEVNEAICDARPPLGQPRTAAPDPEGQKGGSARRSGQRPPPR